MGLWDALRIVASLVLLPLVVGCADMGYRERSTVAHARFATVENYGDKQFLPEQVDDLLEEVAGILNVDLDPSKPKVRVMVMSSGRIADLYRQIVTVTPHGADARALYLPGANFVAVPYYSRQILGHELAHYLTDQYLKNTPRRSWERIALMVEDALPGTPRTVPRWSPTPDSVAARMALLPFAAPYN